ncbi:MAG TPA: BTAD domain-containing putative transcriptional regulator [Conexibacter sp.]|jgi:predicted ATPase/DNA-binding SARP family transcriptional activator
MAEALSIDLFGEFRVSSGERTVGEGTWRLRKARSLIKLLALDRGHALHRDQVLELLWPDLARASAGNNVRQALHVARRALDTLGIDGGAALANDGERVMLDPPGGLRIDVEAFERAAEDALATPTTAALQHAASLYRGELLPEDRYEPWATARRQWLRDRYVVVVVELAAKLEHDGEPAAAIAALLRAVAEDPLHEPAQRALMSLYAATGRRQRALAQFQELRETLRQEVADEPEEETRALYRAILTRNVAEADSERPPAVRRSAPADGVGNGLPLPLPLTSFVGRDEALDEVGTLLGGARLVTLTGPGGGGKTRLALAAAAARVPEHSGGVWLAELAPVADAGGVSPVVAAALGADTRAPRSLLESIAAHVGDASALLVLDNCEHVIDACAELTEGLLQRCAGLTVLATSREPLRIPGEVEWRVPSLTLPASSADVDEAARSGAVRLFCERAVAVAPGFQLDDANVGAVIDVCRRVAGLPLALELAAARVGVLSVSQIAQRLEDSLAVLSGGSRTALTRQQTLTGTLDWSHDLLDAPERVLFRRLAVFAGDCSIESAEEVCSGEGLARADVLDVLARLIDKSLVVPGERDGAVRYRLLAPIRQYALARCEEAGEWAAVDLRHRARYMRLAEEIEEGLLALDPRPALAQAELDNDDLVAARRRALLDDPPVALRFAHALWRGWFARGQLVEADERLEAALAAAPGASPLRAKALLAHAIVAARRGRGQIAVGAAMESLALGEQLGDDHIVAEAHLHVGVLSWAASRLDVAAQQFEGARAAADRLGDRALEVAVLVSRAGLAWSHGQLEEVDRLLEEGLTTLHALPAAEPCFLPVALGLVLEPRNDSPARMHNEDTFAPWRRVRADQAIGHVLASRANAARFRGDLDLAVDLLEVALARFRDLRDQVGTPLALLHLGAVLRDRGELDDGRELIEESLALRERHGDVHQIGIARNALALLNARAGAHAVALSLLERSQAAFGAAGDYVGINATLADSGYAALDAGDLPRARALLEQAYTMASEVFRWHTGAAWLALGLAGEAISAGDRARARERVERARELFAHNADVFGAAACDAALARV